PGSLGRGGAPAFALGARRAAPYAAFLVAPAAAWLAYLIHTGGTR
ncbi:prepilin peptidase, partial [Burkholderia pseudomallei]|nr:prepilin peptidase [Burkholderia pseudomallei]